MEKQAHTPGPWKVRRGTLWGDSACIADLHSWEEDAPDEAKANARLIAAAPDLLFALEQMLEEKCDYMRINHLGDPEQTHTVKVARAAINKATST